MPVFVGLLIIFEIFLILSRVAGNVEYGCGVEIFSFLAFLFSFAVCVKTPVEGYSGGYNAFKEVVLGGIVLFFFILNEFIIRFPNYEIKPLLISLISAVYAAALFVVGFRLKKKHLRYTSVFILVVTALKIVLYDTWENSLALKSVIFISEGVIFLLISYLYSKFFKDK